nr:hypothetical protein [Candidatus Njordarchaeum guaymaensis]
RADLDLALKCDLSGISIELPSSDMWIRKVLMSSRRKIIDQAIESVSYAKEHGLNVAFYLQDAPRADPSFLKQFITVLSNQTKVDAIGLCDSWGIASPEGFRHLIREVRQWTELPIGTHCHNDFGLATANALAGLSAGAIMVTTTVNGIGERCGLTSLEEIAVALRVLYNIDVGIEYRRLCELSRVVEKATKIGISGLKPIVGQRAFAWEKETSIQALERLKAEGGLKAGLPYQPDFVGNNFKVFLGKRTGNRGIAWKASQLGFELTNQQTENALAAVKKSLRKQQPLTDQGFSKILTRILSVS